MGRIKYLFVLIWALSCYFTTIAYSQNNFVVVELFTSQGDINCPPADKILTELNEDANKNGKNIMCISQHVDFWNRFGWKDPYSSLKYTRRLTNYSSVKGEQETYTPYFVINGVPTSSKNVKAEVSKQIAVTREQAINVNMQLFDDTLDIGYTLIGLEKLKKPASAYYLNIVIVEKPVETNVLAGDNKGKTLRNDGVTLMFQTENLKDNKGILRIPTRKVKKSIGRKIIFFIQDKQSKRVVAATWKGFE
ncbi:MAG: DUF1223 domain-containing protein [Bacteroidia bacterium]